VFVHFVKNKLTYGQMTHHFYREILLLHKFTDLIKFSDDDNGMPAYDIPDSSRFTTKRMIDDAPDIVYYFSRPPENNYPIAIMCGGSSDRDHIESIIHFHRYFLQELMDLGFGVLTVEQWGGGRWKKH